MKEWDDDQIQQWLENGGTEPVNNSKPDAIEPNDLNTYQLLFDALKKEPANGLPYNFSVNLEKALILQQQQSRQTLWYAFLGVGVGLVLLSIVLLIMLPTNQIVSQVLLTLSRYKWSLIFGLSSLLIIQLLDQNLVRRNATRHLFRNQTS